MSASEPESRVAWLTARAEITDLVHRYAHAVREGDGGAFAGLFTEDATFEVLERVAGQAETASRMKIAGGEAVASHLATSIASAGDLCPLIHNLLIDLNGDEASSRCVMVGAAGAGVGRFMGAYQDRYRRGPDGWRFTARIFTIHAWAQA